MYRRTALAAAALTVVALVAGCGGGSSYKDKTDACAKAIEARAPGDKAKPQACEAITSDDYDLLNGDAIMRSQGIIDSNGHVDLDKLLSPTP